MTDMLAAGRADRTLRLVVPERLADAAGAVLMDLLGPFEIQDGAAGALSAGLPESTAALVFYPAAQGRRQTREGATLEDILAALPPAMREPGVVRLETYETPRDWVEGWRVHFRPVVIGRVRVRPPWEPPAGSSAREDAGAATTDLPQEALVDVVINPGLGFGTGQHPTTRGVLRLLQEGSHRSQGALVDVGTGSGILAIAAAKAGWSPVLAFDNDPVALRSARENVEANRMTAQVTLQQADVLDVPREWFSEATVVANMTLEPVMNLLGRLALDSEGGTQSPARLAGRGPSRLLVSGVLAGAQERSLLRAARRCGFRPGLAIREAGWVSQELLPKTPSFG